MTITAAKLMVVVDGDTRGAEGALGGLNQRVSGLGGVFQTALGFLTGQLMMSAISNIKNLAGEALNAYADYERLGSSLQSLVARELVNTGQATDLASAMGEATTKAADLQSWIQKLAIQSPFTQAGVADAFKTAMAYGFATDEAQRLTQAMIDFAAGSGATEGAMGQIALALGQIQAKGKLSGQEVLQLVNAGLPVDQILAKAFGKTTAEIVAMREKGLIPADQAIEAIVSSLEKDFGGAAKRQAGTFSGLISSLKDIKEVGLREFFTGTFKAIQPYVQGFVDKFSDPKFMENLRAIGTRIGEGIGQAIVFIQNLKAEFDKFIQGLQQNTTVTTVVNSLREGFANISQWWTANGPGLMEIGQRFFGRIAEIGEYLANQILPWLAGKFAMLTQWFVDNGPLINQFVDVISTAFANIMSVIANAWAFIRPIFDALIATILGIAKIVMQVFVGDWSGAWETVKNTVSVAWDYITQAFNAFANWVTTTFLGVSWLSVVNTLKEDWEMLKTIGSLLWDKITEAWDKAKIRLTKFVDDVSTKINDFKNSVLAPFRDIWDGISDSISKVIDWIGKLIEKLAKVKIPSALDPGSPTPFELGLRGIGNAMADLSRMRVPQLSASLGGMQAAMAGATVNAPVTVNANLNNQVDIYTLARQVAAEIQRSRF